VDDDVEGSIRQPLPLSGAWMPLSRKRRAISGACTPQSRVFTGEGMAMARLFFCGLRLRGLRGGEPGPTNAARDLRLFFGFGIFARRFLRSSVKLSPNGLMTRRVSGWSRASRGSSGGISAARDFFSSGGGGGGFGLGISVPLSRISCAFLEILGVSMSRRSTLRRTPRRRACAAMSKQSGG